MLALVIWCRRFLLTPPFLASVVPLHLCLLNVFLLAPLSYGISFSCHLFFLSPLSLRISLSFSFSIPLSFLTSFSQDISFLSSSFSCDIPFLPKVQDLLSPALLGYAAFRLDSVFIGLTQLVNNTWSPAKLPPQLQARWKRRATPKSMLSATDCSGDVGAMPADCSQQQVCAGLDCLEGAFCVAKRRISSTCYHRLAF